MKLYLPEQTRRKLIKAYSMLENKVSVTLIESTGIFRCSFFLNIKEGLLNRGIYSTIFSIEYNISAVEKT
jgi:hypothetical protein